MASVASDVVASAFIKFGRLHIRNRRYFDEAIRRFRDGSELEVAVTIRRATRSLNSNAFYWGAVIDTISDHTGYSPDEVHELMKMKFIPKRLALQNGNGEVVGEYVMGGSTRKMTNPEFWEYIEAIRRFAAESLDCYIPDPGEGR